MGVNINSLANKGLSVVGKVRKLIPVVRLGQIFRNYREAFTH